MITTDQIKIIQTLLNKRFTDRQERLEFLSDFFGMEIKSTKDLTKIQAIHLTRYLNGEKIEPFQIYAYFDAKNTQHSTILARCHELGWTTTTNSGKLIPDLERLGGFLISKWSPVRKPLMQMNRKEASKIITCLTQILEKKYKQNEQRSN